MLQGCMSTSYGQIAQQFLNATLQNQVLKSGAGYYIGTCDPESRPVSRESREYWRTEKEAEKALATGRWTQRPAP